MPPPYPQSPDTDLKLEVLTPQRLFQYKKRLAEAKSAQARSNFATEPGGGGGTDDPGGALLVPPLSPNLAIPDTIQGRTGITVTVTSLTILCVQLGQPWPSLAEPTLI